MDTTRARRFVLLLSVAWLSGLAAPVAAERIPSKAEPPAASRAADLARVTDAVAREHVAQALAAHGLTAQQVDERLVRLSDDDLHRLATNLDQIQTAGNVPNYIWILLAILIAVTIVATVF